MASGLPVYRHSGAQLSVVRVLWVPTTDGEPVIVDLGGTSGRAFPAFGQSLKVGDEITITRIGQTLQVGSIIRRPTTTPPDTDSTTGGA